MAPESTPRPRRRPCHRSTDASARAATSTIQSGVRAPLALTIPLARAVRRAGGGVGGDGRGGFAGSLTRQGRLGVHTPAAMASDEAFAMANRVAAPVSAGAAAVAAVVAVLVVVLPLSTAGTLGVAVDRSGRSMGDCWSSPGCWATARPGRCRFRPASQGLPALPGAVGAPAEAADAPASPAPTRRTRPVRPELARIMTGPATRPSALRPVGLSSWSDPPGGRPSAPAGTAAGAAPRTTGPSGDRR